jgi:hypothetical protein
MATRFRLENDAGGSIVPTVGETYTHERAVNPCRLTTSALPTTLSSIAYSPDFEVDHLSAGDARHSRFISEPMDAGIGFVTSDTVKYVVQCQEGHNGNNLFVQLVVYVISQDGNTLRATIRSKAVDSLEMVTSTTSRFSSHNLDANYTTVSGDRLVVEFSATGTPTNSGSFQGHNFAMTFGSSGAGDLLENDSQTGATLNPWIEFSRTVTFLVIADEWMGQSCISM